MTLQVLHSIPGPRTDQELVLARQESVKVLAVSIYSTSHRTQADGPFGENRLTQGWLQWRI
jgi:hypothetical protein